MESVCIQIFFFGLIPVLMLRRIQSQKAYSLTKTVYFDVKKNNIWTYFKRYYTWLHMPLVSNIQWFEILWQVYNSFLFCKQSRKLINIPWRYCSLNFGCLLFNVSLFWDCYWSSSQTRCHSDFMSWHIPRWRAVKYNNLCSFILKSCQWRPGHPLQSVCQLWPCELWALFPISW